jgi:hypothetical protein
MKVFWVSKRLAFGSAITTWQHVEKLQARGFTHVINLRHGKHSKKVREFKNLWLPFQDDMKSRPRWFYRCALRFYKRAMLKDFYFIVLDISPADCLVQLKPGASLTEWLVWRSLWLSFGAQRGINLRGSDNHYWLQKDNGSCDDRKKTGGELDLRQRRRRSVSLEDL